MSKTKIEDLAEISTELLVAALKRRSEASGLSVEQLIEKADQNWKEAEDKADALKKLGHEAEGEESK